MALKREVSPTAPRRNLSGLWIAASVMTLIGLILLLVGLTSAGVIHIGPQPTLRGTVLDTPYTAPDFQLKDQFNNPVALSSYHGKVVVLTFLYTNCPGHLPDHHRQAAPERSQSGRGQSESRYSRGECGPRAGHPGRRAAPTASKRTCSSAGTT